MSQSRLETLGQALAVEQDDWRSQQDLKELREVVVATAGPSQRLDRQKAARFGTLGLAAIVAVTACLYFVFSELQPDPLTAEVRGVPLKEYPSRWVSADDKAVPVDFSDGSWMSLSPGARARVVSIDKRGAHVVVESGHANVQVVPRPDAEWKVSFGPFVVDVIGTRFDAKWTPEEDLFELSLHRGHVSVSGCVFGNDGRRIATGETVRASCRSGHFEVSTTQADAATNEPTRDAAAGVASSSALDEREHDKPTPPSAPPAPHPTPTWQQLAHANDYRAAFEAANSLGFGTQLHTLSPNDLALLADVARFAGKPGHSRRAYSALRQRFPGSTRAATAAYQLARLAFDSQSDYGQAARWFRTYLAERPNGALAREALGRLMEAELGMGDRAAARRTATRYLKRYPDGPHAHAARKLR